MGYTPVELEDTINVERMVTVHYFQFARGYLFAGEQHDFWEFVYMDKGAAEIGADGKRFVLNESEAIFHKPGEFHTIWAGGDNPPDIVVISFVCRSQAMQSFCCLHTSIDQQGKALIAQVIKEARGAWENKLSTDYQVLVRRSGGPVGSEQMVRLSLEALLIQLLRSMDGASPIKEEIKVHTAKPKTFKGRKEYLYGLAEEIEYWFAGHMEEKITIGSLCRRFNISATSLKNLFRQKTGGGINEYLSGIRHEAAKRLIRDGRISMKAICEKCGYGSIHYFSRKFTQMEGMTPTEYARSVKSMASLPENSNGMEYTRYS